MFVCLCVYSYGAPPAAASLSYGSAVSAAAVAATEGPYHAAVAFQYHGVGRSSSDGVNNNSDSNDYTDKTVANSNSNKNVATDAVKSNGRTLKADDNNNKSDSDDSDNDVPVAYFEPRHRFLSASINSVSMTSYGDVTSVIRREEITLSKKLHRNKSTQPDGRGLQPQTSQSEVIGSSSHESESANNLNKKESNNSSADDDNNTETSELAATPMELARKTYGDYNGRLQDLQDHRKQLATKGGIGMAEAQARVLGLADDFLESAKRYGRIVIDEAFVAPKDRTIKPLSEGGNVYQVR